MISGIHLATALSVMLHMEQEGNGMDTSQDHLYVIGDTERVLGLTKDQMLDMGLREFVTHCLDRGSVPHIGMNGIAPGLTVDFSTEAKVGHE